MKYLILTGFKPASPNIQDTSWNMAYPMNHRMLQNFCVKARIFGANIPPPPEDRGTALLEIAVEEEVKGIVCLGSNTLNDDIVVEMTTMNRIFADNCPSNGHCIDYQRPYGEEIQLELRIWNLMSFQGACRDESISIKLSSNPGGSYENHLMYQMRAAQSASDRFGGIPWIFVRLPEKGGRNNFHALEILLERSRL